MVPLLVRSWHARLGEPFADDFDFLHRALLEPHRSWFDGGGREHLTRHASRHPKAMAQLDTLLAAYPCDGSARDMLDSLRALTAR